MVLPLLLSLTGLSCRIDDRAAAIQFLHKLGAIKEGYVIRGGEAEIVTEGPWSFVLRTGEFTVRLRSDQSLFSFDWHPLSEVEEKRRNVVGTRSDSWVVAEAKRYPQLMWPNQRFVFSRPGNGSD